jgi:hypothetical protein
LVWFKVMINFQDETQNLAKCAHFDKFIFIKKWLSQNMSSIGGIIFNNKLQNISFKISFIWKSGKDWKKNLESFCKVIQLAPIYDVSYHLYVWYFKIFIHCMMIFFFQNTKLWVFTMWILYMRNNLWFHFFDVLKCFQ